MRRAREPLSASTLAAYLEGEVTRSEGAEIEGMLEGAPEARRQLEQLAELRRALSRSPDPVAGMDLVAGVRRAIAAPAPRRRQVARWSVYLSAGAAAALLAVVVVRQVSPADRPAADEFRTKSAGVADDGERWIALEVFRVTPGPTAPLADGGQLDRDDGLGFRYTNGGARPFGYLMVFAVDATGELRWYYPAYQSSDGDPPSLPIERGDRPVALPEAVHHPLPPGPIAIHALFSHQPLRVTHVEGVVGALVRAGALDLAAPRRLPFPGTGQQILAAWVR